MLRTLEALVAIVAVIALGAATSAALPASSPMSGAKPAFQGAAMPGAGMGPGMRARGMDGPGMGPRGMGSRGMRERGMGGRVMRGDVNAWFIERMIPHHESAVEMAKLALAGRAEHAELRTLATNIKRVQRREIAQMRRWYRQWYQREAPKVEMGMRMDLDALAGARPFDPAFNEMMIPHHSQAVMMSSMALRRAPRPELRRLLRSIVRSQTAEINQMAAWYQTWYGRAVAGGQGCGMTGGGPGSGMGAAPGPGTGPDGGPGAGNGPMRRGGRGVMMGARRWAQ